MRAFALLWTLLLAGWACGQKPVTNVFSDADIRTVLSELASAAGVTIIPDASVKDLTISLELKEEAIERALDKVALFGNLVWKKKGDLYLVSTGAPDAPLFLEFAVTRAYSPRTQAAESLFALLSQSQQVFARLDRNANLLSITGPERTVEKILLALAEIDAPRTQFVVEAVVAEIKEDTGRETGFSWSWKGLSGDLAGIAFSSATSDDVAKLRAMATAGKAELRANPRVVATVGKEATITVGNETYFPIVSGPAQLPTLNLQRISTGITLKFTGFAEPDGTLNLRLAPEVSDAVAQVHGAPTTTVRRAETTLRVRSGETIALGGLLIDNEKRVSTKIPVLGDLPLVGGLFRGNKMSRQKTEVVILITPRIIPAMAAKD